MKIALASDHAGLEQLAEIKEFLQDSGHECIDFGPKNYNPADDYPDFIVPAAKAVSNGECEAGIVLGGSGQGEAMAANKVSKVRCALFYGPAVAKGVVDADGRSSHEPYEIVKLSRDHNNANMLSLAARFVSIAEMKQVIELWLKTPFSEGERHARRVKKLDEL